jgi:hypothetical protein
MEWAGEALMAEYFAQIGESLRTHEDVCHDLTAEECAAGN